MAIDPQWDNLFSSIEQIKNFKNSICELKIQFKYDDKVYSTSLNVKTWETNILFQNECIQLSLFKNSNSAQRESELKKNTLENPCFSPPFNQSGYARLLQEIMSSLSFFFLNEIKIVDVAKIDNINISPFNFLRGKSLIYEPLGFLPEYYDLEGLRKFIKETPIAVLFNKYPRINNRINFFVKEGILIDEFQTIIEYMTKISFELESEELKTQSKFSDSFSKLIYEYSVKHCFPGTTHIMFMMATKERFLASSARKVQFVNTHIENLREMPAKIIIEGKNYGRARRRSRAARILRKNRSRRYR